ncbi:MAG: hypothetical protein IPN37_08765 [Betaproteobacteria bacterium]|nr:hypothetical protein [Betaproteobacteria bacterium]MBK7458121.1 hypothetical protein [Betaproteobacteria bacterium]MBK8107399.1 hypothetical protein [Betaproteobacteria bacterium]MBK8864092.1 hypothetical protein [Betaproteobacteria bacterium]
MQIMIQACARDGRGDEFKDWCVDTLGPALLAGDSTIDGLIVNQAMPVLAPQPYGGGEALDGDAFDVVLQLWTASVDDAVRALRPHAAELAARTCLQHVYRLSGTESLPRPDGFRGTPTPGIKLIRGLFLFDDLPDAAAQRLWAHHAELAVKVHVGLARYARHWVDEVLTPGSPRIRGLSDLHFPDEEAMRDRYFDSPRGRDEIWHDIGHFICGGTQRFYGREFVLR